MYRVLLVDDEPFIVDTLSDLLESQEELEVDVCRAYSSAQALGWLRRAAVDILVSDIEMPGVSGLELAETVRREWPRCKVLFLTAHAQFSYAYRAIQSNVVSYILKTAGDREILDEIKKAAALLDEELRTEATLADAHHRLETSAGLVRRDLLLSLLEGPEDPPETVFAQLSQAGASFQAEEPFLVACGRMGRSRAPETRGEKVRRLAAVEEIAGRLLDGEYRWACVNYDGLKTAWLLQPMTPRTALFAADLLERIQQACAQAQGVTVSFVLAGEGVPAGEIPGAFSRADAMIRSCTQPLDAFVRMAGPEPEESRPAPGGRRSRTDLRALLEEGREEALSALLADIRGTLAACRSWNDPAATELYFDTALTVFSWACRQEAGRDPEVQHPIRRLLEPQTFPGWDSAMDALIQAVRGLFREESRKETSLSGNIVRFLKEYIKDHIQEDVSLTKLAEVSGYNATYLSRVFSESTGQTLKAYAMEKRLQRITDLIRQGIPLNDVAQAAGFEDRSYFNKFVRRATGLSPAELRSRLLN